MGLPAANWDVTINNGPRDYRWSALPPGDRLEFGYLLADTVFRAPGRYVLVLVTGRGRSAPLVVTLW